MMWLNWQKWIKISSVFKMKLTTILNINLHRYNEHVRSVWSHLVDNLYYRLSEIFLTQALAIWSCEIFLNSKLVACKYLNLLSVFSGEPRASLKKKSCLFRVSKSICTVTTRIDEQMTNCIILRLFNTHTLVYEFCTWSCRSHTRLEWFSSAEGQTNLSISVFSSGAGKLRSLLL